MGEGSFFFEQKESGGQAGRCVLGQERGNIE